MVDYPRIALQGRAVEVSMLAPDGGDAVRVGLVFDCNVLADLEALYADGIDAPVIDEEPLVADGQLVLDGEGNRVVVSRPLLDGNNRVVTQRIVGIEAWQHAMTSTPFMAMRRTYGVLLGEDERAVGARLIPDLMQDYLVALGTAFAIANGMDPTQALNGALTQMGAMRARLDAVGSGSNGDSAPVVTAADSLTPGTPGLPVGPAPADPSASSGS